MSEEPVAGPLWGPATRRAVEAFPVSTQRMPVRFLHALVLLKRCAAAANEELGLLDPDKAEAIRTAADAVLAGDYWEQFPLDLYQVGSGTSSNMNCNEVLAALALRLRGVQVHPNDHVNLCQSSNDVVPTAMRLAFASVLKDELLPALERTHAALAAKAVEFWPVIKIARTHWQDATPMRLGQEFWGYTGQLERAGLRVAAALGALRELPLGGTAVGTGINCHPEFAARTIAGISERLGIEFVESSNHFQAQATLDDVISAHGELRAVALAVHKIASDIRLLGTGPRAGIGELRLPDVGVASSIMPGKVPPSIIESLIMVVARVVGNDGVVAFSQSGSIFELNVMLPVSIAAVLESTELLASGLDNFVERCVRGISATDVGPSHVENSVMLTTALSPLIGYDRAAQITREVLETGERVRAVAARSGIDDEALSRALDPAALTGAAEVPPPMEWPL